MTIYTGTAQPANPIIGATFYDIVSNVMRIHDGSQWVAVSPDGMEELLWNECNNITLEKERGIYESTG